MIGQARRWAAAAWVLAASGAFAMACGGATPAAKAVGEPEPAKPVSVEEALAQIDRAEGNVLAALGGPGGDAQPMGPTLPPGAVPGAQQPSPDAAPRGAEGAPAAPVMTATSDPCETACRALGSMTRATDSLCGMTGDGDERCGGARERVRAATERVRARCPACG